MNTRPPRSWRAIGIVGATSLALGCTALAAAAWISAGSDTLRATGLFAGLITAAAVFSLLGVIALTISINRKPCEHRVEVAVYRDPHNPVEVAVFLDGHRADVQLTAEIDPRTYTTATEWLRSGLDAVTVTGASQAWVEQTAGWYATSAHLDDKNGQVS